jgi:hypothetical protein
MQKIFHHKLSPTKSGFFEKTSIGRFFSPIRSDLFVATRPIKTQAR